MFCWRFLLYWKVWHIYVTHILTITKRFIRSRLLALSTSSSMSTHTSVLCMPYVFHIYMFFWVHPRHQMSIDPGRWTSGVAEDFIWDIPGPWIERKIGRMVDSENCGTPQMMFGSKSVTVCFMQGYGSLMLDKKMNDYLRRQVEMVSSN